VPAERLRELAPDATLAGGKVVWETRAGIV